VPARAERGAVVNALLDGSVQLRDADALALLAFALLSREWQTTKSIARALGHPDDLRPVRKALDRLHDAGLAEVAIRGDGGRAWRRAIAGRGLG